MPQLFHGASAFSKFLSHRSTQMKHGWGKRRKSDRRHPNLRLPVPIRVSSVFICGSNLKLAAPDFAHILPRVRTVNVSLGSRSYRIHIGSGLLARLGTECARLDLGRRCAIISDRHVAKHYARATQTSLRRAGFDPVLIVVPPGETSKRLASVEFCYDRLAS